MKELRLPLLSAIPIAVLSACVSIAPIEPIKNPPLQYRANSTVLVEFVHPTKIGLRCAERGASAHGLPMAMACADKGLMTMPNPCVTITGGKYANGLCEQKRRPVSDADLFSPIGLATIDLRMKPRALNAAKESNHKFVVEFVLPNEVERRCNERGLHMRNGKSEGDQTCGNDFLITAVNPCLKMASGWYARTMCHELGHVNGWSTNHRGGSYRSDTALGIDSTKIPPPIEVIEIMRTQDVPPPASSSPTFLAFKAEGKNEAVKPSLDQRIVIADLPEISDEANDTSETSPEMPNLEIPYLDQFDVPFVLRGRYNRVVHAWMNRAVTFVDDYFLM